MKISRRAALVASHDHVQDVREVPGGGHSPAAEAIRGHRGATDAFAFASHVARTDHGRDIVEPQGGSRT